MSDLIHINARAVGTGRPAYIVAELSANHNGSLERALESVRAAASAGADAIKFQTYTPDTLTIDSDREDFKIRQGAWRGRTLYDLYAEAYTPWQWHAPLFAEGRAAGLDVFSTPFDDTAVDLLESLDAPAYKVASFELMDDALLARVAKTGKPVVISTGMATLEEIAHAVQVLRGAGAQEILCLRCTSSYPAPDDAMHLATIPAIRAALQLPVGLSDHSMGTTAPVVAVTLGACFIEKHFTLARADGGVDSHFSLEPAEFAQMVKDVRRAEAMLGRVTFGASDAEESSRVFRRSLYVVADLQPGDELTPANLRAIRPGYGLPPRHLSALLGRRVRRAIARGTPFDWELLA